MKVTRLPRGASGTQATPFSPRLTALAASLLVLGATSLPAHAYETKLGDFDLTINSTVSVGTSIRMEDRDPALVGANNTFQQDGQTVRGTGFTAASDDGNLNFAKGDAFSTILKGSHEFKLSKDNYGFFTRVNWFKDFALASGDVPHGHEPNNYAAGAGLDDSGFNKAAQFEGILLQDAYAFLDTELADRPLNLRLGRQVIFWGESTLIFSPLSLYNTVDLNAFRRPGASLKEGLTPSESIYANWSIAPNTSLEAFAQLQWRKTVQEGCGTFFSSSDFAADGCDRLAPIVGVTGVGATPSDQMQFASPSGIAVPAFNFGGGLVLAGAPGSGATFALSDRFFVNRSPDKEPNNLGQFGVALRRFVEPIGTEFGAYAMNYHARVPVFGIVKSQDGRPLLTPDVVPTGTAPTGLSAPNPTLVATGVAPNPANGNSTGYFAEYPENQQVLGLSFATNLGKWSWSGEVTRAIDRPVQINTNALLAAGLQGSGPFAARFAAATNGSEISGYDSFNVNQIQTSFIRAFDRVLGASQTFFLGEVGAVLVEGLPDASVLPYGRGAIFGDTAQAGTTDGYTSSFSWGYRARVRSIYPNVFGDVDLEPTVAWSHDVKGWAPEPAQAFNEGRRSVGLGLDFVFTPNSRLGVNYVRFMNSGRFDPLRDRDFLSVAYTQSF